MALDKAYLIDMLKAATFFARSANSYFIELWLVKRKRRLLLPLLLLLFPIIPSVFRRPTALLFLNPGRSLPTTLAFSIQKHIFFLLIALRPPLKHSICGHPVGGLLEVFIHLANVIRHHWSHQ